MEDLYLVNQEENLDAETSDRFPSFDAHPLVAAAEQDHIVMFTDLVGFTKITATTGSRATGALLSQVLTTQIAIIQAAGGVIRNIMGDAIMASWAIDRESGRSATCSRALRASFAIISAMQQIPSPLPRRRSLAVRIGLHVGSALLGTLWNGHASGRTLIGDAVNIAARLQQARRSGAAAQTIGPVRVSAEFYRELPADQQRLLPDRTSLRACGRILQMHSGGGTAGASSRDRGTGVAIPTYPAHPFGWVACLDRLASYVAVA